MIHDQGDMIGKCVQIREVSSEFNYAFCWHKLNFPVFHLKSIVFLVGVFKHWSSEIFYKVFSYFSIDSIEANVESAEVHVERASEQLQRAAYYQVDSVCSYYWAIMEQA